MKKLILFLCFYILFLSSYAVSQNYKTIDTMDLPSSWNKGEDDKGSKVNLATTDGKFSSALSLDFDLGNGTWVQIWKDMKIDLTGVEKIRFYYKYKGPANNLEVKFLDADGSNFGLKIELRQSDQWTMKEIDINQFTYWWGGNSSLDLNNITSIYFAVSKVAGGKGEVLIDQVEYFGENIIGDEVALVEGMVIIDEFERIDPLTMYIPMKEDESSLVLSPTRQYVKEGNYSMEMEYELSTTRAIPSTVRANWKGKLALNWKGVETVNIWVKGDGSGNYFYINLIDSSGETWSYEDKSVLLYTDWKLISIPIEKFKIPSWGKKKDGKFDGKIISYEMGIRGRVPENSNGKIYVDHFYVVGKDLISAQVTPEEVRKPVTLLRPQGNLDIRGLAVAEYKHLPNLGHDLILYTRLFFEAKVNKFGAYTELTTTAQEFGEAAAINQDGNLEERKPGIEVTSIRLYANDILPSIKYISLGNVWIDYSMYTFSPFHTRTGEWGYKGLVVETKVDKLSPQGFLLKHKHDSFSYGAKIDSSYGDIFIRGIAVEYSSRAKVQKDGDIINGVIDKSKTGDVVTERIEDDLVYTLEAEKKLFKVLTLRGLFGQNKRVKYAIADYSDPFNPIFNYKLETQEKKTGNMIKGEIEVNNVPMEESKLYMSLQDADNNYKPKYRREPDEFDELESNLFGYKTRLSQGYRGWGLSLEYQHFNRKDNKSKYRTWAMWGLDRYNWNNFDFSFHQEYKWQDDAYDQFIIPDKVNKNEKTIANIFRINYRFSSEVNVVDELRFEDIIQRDTGNRFSGGKLYFKIEYYLFGSNKLLLESQFAKLGDSNWRSNTDDNFFKLVMELQF